MGKPFQIGSGLAKKLQLQLFELAGAENKLFRGDFVSESFPDLAYAKRNFFTRCAQNVFKVYKNALSGFGAQVNGAFGVLDRAGKRFKHEVKLANIGKIMFAAAWARDVFFVDK